MSFPTRFPALRREGDDFLGVEVRLRNEEAATAMVDLSAASVPDAVITAEDHVRALTGDGTWIVDAWRAS